VRLWREGDVTEKTEAEKTQELFERKIKEREHELETLRQREIEQIDKRICEMRARFEDEKKELLAQNDGLLGAVGRLHAENETLRKQISDLEPVVFRAKEDIARYKKDFEFAEEHARERLETAHREYDYEVKRLTIELADLRKQKKKA